MYGNDQHLKKKRNQREYPPVDIGCFKDSMMKRFEIPVVDQQMREEKDDHQQIFKGITAEGNVVDESDTIGDESVDVDPTPEVEKNLRDFVSRNDQKDQKVGNGHGGKIDTMEDVTAKGNDYAGIGSYTNQRRHCKYAQEFLG